MEFLARFRSLPRPDIESGSNTFAVFSVANSPYRIGKDGSGAPALLVQVAGGGGSGGPIALQHITVQHEVRCRFAGVGVGAASREEVVSLVRCASGEPTLREYFVRVLEVTVRQLGSKPTRNEVNRAIKRLTELFRAFEQPAQRTVQGLWGELVIIVLSGAPDAVVSAWRVDRDEAFDFAAGPARIEVKSFASVARAHSFSLRQVRPGTGIDVVIASVRSERSSGGTSIGDLMLQLGQRGLATELMAKVELVVAQSLGEAAGSGLSMTFDLERARESLRFFDALSVPSIDPVLPPGVVSVRFESLLNEDAALQNAALRARGPLFRDVVPAG